MGGPESRKRGRRGFGVWVWRKSRALAGTERLRLRKRRRVFRVRRGGEKKMKNKAPLSCRNLGRARRDFDCSGGRKEMVKRRGVSLCSHWIRWCRFSRYRGGEILCWIKRFFSVMFWVFKAHLKAHYITVRYIKSPAYIFIENFVCYGFFFYLDSVCFCSFTTKIYPRIVSSFVKKNSDKIRILLILKIKNS